MSHVAGHAQPRLLECSTSLLFGAGSQPPMSTRCSLATPSCTSSWYNITSKLYLVPHRVTVQRVGVLPTFRESSPSSKLLQTQQSTIWWTNNALGMAGILLCSFIAQQCSVLASFKSYGAIYSQSPTTGRRLSDDTVPTWSREPADMCVIKGNDFIHYLAMSLSLVHQ
jgi:hypothetical protein